VDAPGDAQHGARDDVRGPDREAVHRGAVEGRRVVVEKDVLGEDAADRGPEGDRLGRYARRARGARDGSEGVLDGQHARDETTAVAQSRPRAGRTG